MYGVKSRLWFIIWFGGNCAYEEDEQCRRFIGVYRMLVVCCLGIKNCRWKVM